MSLQRDDEPNIKYPLKTGILGVFLLLAGSLLCYLREEVAPSIPSAVVLVVFCLGVVILVGLLLYGAATSNHEPERRKPRRQLGDHSPGYPSPPPRFIRRPIR